VEDEPSREAGYDVGRIFAELRATEAQAPGCLIRSPEELQRYATEQQRRCASGLAFNEGP
jgi:hypothetical protein